MSSLEGIANEKLTGSAGPSGPAPPPPQESRGARPRDREGRFLRTDGRAPNGRFTTGAPGPRLTTGKYSELLASGAIDGRTDELTRMRSDLERGDLTIVRSALARRFTAIDAMAQNLEDQIQAMGLVSAKGRKRSIGAAYFDAARLLLSYADRLGIPPPPKRGSSIPADLTAAQLLARLDAMAAKFRSLQPDASSTQSIDDPVADGSTTVDAALVADDAETFELPE